MGKLPSGSYRCRFSDTAAFHSSPYIPRWLRIELGNPLVVLHPDTMPLQSIQSAKSPPNFSSFFTCTTFKNQLIFQRQFFRFLNKLKRH
jgi:hypothetical protein